MGVGRFRVRTQAGRMMWKATPFRRLKYWTRTTYMGKWVTRLSRGTGAEGSFHSVRSLGHMKYRGHERGGAWGAVVIYP